MKLWIETPALQGPSEHLLWSGTIFGLIYLRQFEHYCSFNVGDLSSEQQNLLHHENLHTESFVRDEADVMVGAKKNRLILKTEDGNPQFFDDWTALSSAVCFPRRRAKYHRHTAETDILIEINLDGTGKYNIETGLGFLNHMLEQLAKHSLLDLNIRCEGDLEVDEHHSIEDIAIALGTAIRKAIGNKKGINRYGFSLPMDESAATVLLDFSGRPHLEFTGNFSREKVGDFPTEMTGHFFRSLAMNLKATLHITAEGENDHHKIEAIFKSFARCLRGAVSRSERNLNILPSTKDLL